MDRFGRQSSAPATGSLSLAARVLLAAAGSPRFRDDDCHPRDEDEPLSADFALLARWHRLAPAVFKHLRTDPAADPALLKALQHDVLRQGLVRCAMTADLAWLKQRLAEVGGEWAVVKGPVVAEHLWPRPQDRQYHDLDVLVSRRDFAAVVELLEEEGMLVDRNWPLVWKQGRSQLSFRLPQGTSLDLHWDLVHERDARASLMLRPQDLLDRAVPTTALGVGVKTLDATDTMLHLAYHAASSGAHRLVWLRDMQLAAAAVPDPDVLAQRSLTTKTHLILAAVLGRVRRVFGSPASPSLGLGPAPTLWVSLGRAVDQRYPVPYVGGRGTGQTYYRCLRDGPTSSAACLVHTLAEHARARPAEPGLGHQNPLHLDVPDRRARRHFLSSLDAGADG